MTARTKAGRAKVYNPFDILLLFDTREPKAHWFKTGSPTFLVETLLRRAPYASIRQLCMNRSMSPSRTASALPISRLVRWSLTMR